jgi:hypothetical protein
VIFISRIQNDNSLNQTCILGNDVLLYESKICEILTHIRKPGDFRTPPKIAIISPTSYSRTVVADSIAREISVLVKRKNFSGEPFGKRELENLFEEHAVYVCEECQYLYERRPHGFDLLRLFLSSLVTNSRQVITTWNQYSWNFLSGFLHIERWFPIIITLPLLSLPELKKYLIADGKENLHFIIDTELDNSLELVRKDYDITISSLNLSFSIPYLTVQRRYASYIPLLADKQALPEELIFREIYRLSSGEPGIALKIFHDAIVEDEIRVTHLPKPLSVPELYAIDIFVLTLILMYELPVYSRLNESIQDKAMLNSSLYRLVSSGLVIRNEEVWCISLEGFAPVVDYLKQRRMIW